MQFLLAIAIGLGLSAASGFRVFVPMLGLSIGARMGIIPLGSSFEWISSPLAITVFTVATLAEIAAFYIPWVDNALDTIASPAAVIAGTVITASVLGDIPSAIKWPMAIIAGGGTAGIIQGSTVLSRGTSTVTTGGTGNPIVSTLELISSIVTTILTIVVPYIIATVIIILLFFLGRRIYKSMTRNKLATANR